MVKNCRTCSRNDQFEGISVNAFSESHQEPIYLMLIYCTQLQFSTNDTLPQQICPECLVLLDGAFTFWKQSRRTDADFRYGILNRLVVEPPVPDDPPVFPVEAASPETLPIPPDPVIAASPETLPIPPVPVIAASPETPPTPQSFFCCFRKCLKVTTSLEDMEQHAQQHHFAARLANEIQRVPDLGYICSVCCAGYNSLGGFEYHRMIQLGTRQKDVPSASSKNKQKKKEQKNPLEDSEPAETTVVKEELNLVDCPESITEAIQFETVSVKDEPYLSEEDESSPQQDTPGNAGYRCNACQRSFNTVEGLKQHVTFCSAPTDNAKYTCLNCCRAFNTKTNFEQHINRRACLKDPHQCKNCFSKFPNMIALKRHRKVGCPALLNAETSGVKMTCNCERCGKGFVTKRLLRLHTLVDGCGTSRATKMPAHSKTQCPYCFLQLSRASNLKRHLELHCLVLLRKQAEREHIAAAQDTTMMAETSTGGGT